jgi:integrase
MAKHKLSDKAVKNAKGKKYFADGGGLYLKLTTTGSKSWCFRWWDKTDAQPGERGKLREMGLGAYPNTPLAQARDKAEAALVIAVAGGNPIKARATVEHQTQVKVLKEVGQAAPGVMSFDKCAKRYIDKMLVPITKKGKNVEQWRSSIEQYVSPHIGSMDVAEIDTDDVMRVLVPIWHKVPETASRVRMRIENVLAWSTAMKYRTGFNPGVWRGNLSQLLPDKNKVAPVKHFPALPYSELPALYAELVAKNSHTSRALRLTMLTACRTGEIIGAEWSEIEDGVWTIPGERMKAGKEHSVPIMGEAAKVIALLDDSRKYLFPARQGTGHMSNMAMLQLLKVMRDNATVHGFRSGFRDWAAEETEHANHVCEMALAHTVKGVEGSYRRGNLLEKRAVLMNDWADYLTDLLKDD